ncbi:MAG: fused MFS/spermidine synthase [Pseudobutyrivibrio sp.]|nr:fused MFS/spermidine synthase [Pseudobutyrivibrio sp.]
MDRPILKNKLYLYLTEFFAGMSVMAVELGASRLLAPYFSSSQIVWTIIIGTIMIAMALGNLYGGRAADKDPNPDKLYLRIIIAAIWIAAIPVVGKYIIIGISALLILTVNSNFLVLAGFVACMVIFVFPLFLLGTVTPSLVKFSVDSLDDSGSVVGRLNASNTIGSIIGTFVPTFISIPAVGTSITFLIFAGILLVLCIVYFVSSKINFSQAKRVPISIILYLVCILLGHNNSFAFWQTNLTYEGESIYNYLQVSENDERVALSTNVLFGVQSIYQKEKGSTGMYYDYAIASLYMAGISDDTGADVLILGNGSGTFATQCERYFDNINITGVEIDQKITDLAYEYFELPEDIDVVTYDGRAYLNAIDSKYDVIMVDAYQDITIPFQMSSVEFFSEVKNHLKDNGVMVVNMNMRSDSEGNINEYLSDTIGSVFPYMYTTDVKGWSNRILYASANSDMAERLVESVEAEPNEDLQLMLARAIEGLRIYEAGDLVMTDDKAPVELLGMRAIDEIIADEVNYYKDIFKAEGVQGLIDML